MSIKWQIQTKKIKDLVDYEKNPRKLTKTQAEHLQVSIEKFGLIDKPFINLDNTIIGGHQRVRLLKKLGKNEIEVHVPDRSLEPQEIEELNFRHNQNHGDWDFDILGNEYDIEDLINWGATQEMLGISEDQAEKPKKYSITLEFTDKMHLEESFERIESVVQEISAKMKIKA